MPEWMPNTSLMRLWKRGFFGSSGTRTFLSSVCSPPSLEPEVPRWRLPLIGFVISISASVQTASSDKASKRLPIWMSLCRGCWLRAFWCGFALLCCNGSDGLKEDRSGVCWRVRHCFRCVFMSVIGMYILQMIQCAQMCGVCWLLFVCIACLMCDLYTLS